jgi:hypothetical protein
MWPAKDNSPPSRAGIVAIILALALGGPAALLFGFVGSLGNGLGGTFTVLTLPNWSIIGACVGASLGGMTALLCGCDLQRGFCYLFGAALGCIVCLVGYGQFSPTVPTPEALLNARHKEQQIYCDALAAGLISLGLLGGAASRPVIEFGARSRLWAGISAGIFVLVGAVVTYGRYKERLALDQQLGVRVDVLICVLIAALFGGLVGSLAGAIRDSARIRKATDHSAGPADD